MSASFFGAFTPTFSASYSALTVKVWVPVVAANSVPTELPSSTKVYLIALYSDTPAWAPSPFAGVYPFNTAAILPLFATVTVYKI